MSTYKTGNPLGSAAVKDLFDNAENLDFALNSLTALIWTDRLGKTRRSFFGMESAFVTQLTSQESRFNSFIQSSGYQIVGDYTAGPLTLTEYNQLIRYNNELYKLTAATDIPFTTAGNTDETWTSTDAAHFVSVGDAALRQNLGSSELPGATLVALPYGTVASAIQFFTPEMWGCVGDGETDDYANFQAMLDAVPSGATIHLDGRKTYYNAFPTSGLNGSWTISKPMTIHCNGAKITRRVADTSDGQSSLFFIHNASNVKLLNVNIDGNNPLGYPYKGDGTQNTSGKQTSLCQAIDYGIYILGSSDIEITGKIQKCALNIWAKSSSRFRVNGTLDYGGQVVPNVTSSDLAYGAGIKVSDSSDYDINVTGEGNANATVELEPNANNGHVVCRSVNNLSSGLTITNSNNIEFEAYTYGASIGTQATQGVNFQVYGICGQSIAESCSWGLLLNQRSDAAYSMKMLNITAQSNACTSYGLYILNNSSLPLNSYDINYTGDGNYSQGAGARGNDVVVTGDCRGIVRGKSANCYNAFLVSGTQNKALPPRFNMDVRETSSVDYYISAGSYADISGTVTKTTHVISGGSNITKAHVYQLGAGGAQSALADWMVKSEHYYCIPMPTSYTFNNSLYGVLDSGATNTYTLKVRM
ncbi:hypothetical protein [Klebsiella pneumoniae]|uniref:hypothetical protein n=1 Tax=Klebsiella pneumoniae TaxID=573 RepID=UPI001CA5CFA4|nr:hypothetical protein [Klebsiella pneumoniae]MBW6028367.1 hypothetical protein [Klebsiella pneumoniae]